MTLTKQETPLPIMLDCVETATFFGLKNAPPTSIVLYGPCNHCGTMTPVELTFKDLKTLIRTFKKQRRTK